MKTDTKSILFLGLLLTWNCIGEPAVFVELEDLGNPGDLSDMAFDSELDMSFDEDNIGPTVLKYSPAHQVDNIDPDSQISVIFSEAMNADGFTAENVKLTDGKGPVPIEIKYDEKKNTLFLDNMTLGLLASYSVHLETGITDLVGNELEEKAWTFQTRDGTWSESQILEKAFDSAIFPSISMNETGDSVAGWSTSNSGGNAYLNRYDHASGEWGTPEHLFRSDTAIYEVSGSIDDAGNIMAKWSHERPPELNNIFSTKYFDKKTQTWGPTKEHEVGGAIEVINEKEEITFIWQGEDHIKISTFNKWLKSWSTPKALLKSKRGFSVTSDPAGNRFLFAIEYDEINSQDLVKSIFYDSQTRSWEEAKIHNLDYLGQRAFQPSVCSASDGRFIAIWSEFDGISKWHIQYSEYRPQSEQWSTPFIVAQENTLRQLRCWADESGTHVLWRTEKIIKGRRFDQDAQTWKVRDELVQSDSTRFDLSFDRLGNGFLFWSTDHFLFAQRYDERQRSWGRSVKISETVFGLGFGHANRNNGLTSIVWSEQDELGIWNVRAKTFR